MPEWQIEKQSGIFCINSGVVAQLKSMTMAEHEFWYLSQIMVRDDTHVVKFTREIESIRLNTSKVYDQLLLEYLLKNLFVLSVGKIKSALCPKQKMSK